MIALIFGVGGQDGYYLADLLLSEGFEVIGAVRRSSQPRDYLIPLLNKGLKIVEADITDYSSIESLVKRTMPDHVYNLSAQSHVGTSFHQPLYTWDVTAKGVLNILEVLRTVHPTARFYQASSSEMFGKSVTKKKVTSTCAHERDYIGARSCECEYQLLRYQDEETPFIPQSPYAIAKLAAHESVRLYRQSYGMFACGGILFNHESERRGEMFVTRKVTKYIGRLLAWKENLELSESGGIDYDYNITPDFISSVRLNQNKEPYGHRDAWLFGPKFPKLKLGNLNACRDWSHAEDMVRAMYLMLCAKTPKDYVVGSGETHSVEEFVSKAFEYVGLDYKSYIEIDKELIRPSEVDFLLSRPTKIKMELKWAPKLNFDGLVRRMVDYDTEREKAKSALYGRV